ncbi:WSC domain containing protein [Rhypophila decipiens]
MASILSRGLRAVTLLCLLAQAVDALRGRGQCSVPTRYSALGCHVDNENGRALTGPSFQNEGMTVRACRRTCSTFEYFGVENGVECFCGDTLNASTAGVGECNFPCGGNATETCGAVNRLNVFKKDGLDVVSSTLSSSAIMTAPASSTTESTQSSSSTSASSSASSTGSESLTSTVWSTEPSSPSSSSTLLSSPSLSSTSSSSSSSSSPLSSSSAVPATTSTTSTFSVPSTTAAALPTSMTSTTSTTSITSTTSQCPLTTSMTVGSTACWGSIPSPCSTLSSYLGAAAGSTAASSCLTAFMSANAVHPSIVPCFSNLAYPTFSPQRAYTCVSDAGSAVYCPSTTKCIPTTGPLQTNLIPNGNFNSGANIFDPWVLTYSSGSEPMISSSITSGTTRSGIFSLKIYYNNQDPGGERQWAQDINGLVPGAQYELSYYWYQNFGQTRMSSYIRFLGPGGVSVVAKEFSHFNTGAGVWTKVTETFVPGASFGRVVFGVRAVRGGGPGTLWIDDVFVKRLAW